MHDGGKGGGKDENNTYIVGMFFFISGVCWVQVLGKESEDWAVEHTK